MRLIDADALADKMMKADMPPHDIGGRYQTGFMDARSMVITAPSIDPVKHGKWIADKYTRKCSECESTYWMREGNEWNYCPNCGSKNGGEG